MPKGRRGELEYPTHQHSAEEDRRHSLWLLALGPIVAVIAFVIENVFQTFWLATYVFGLVTTVALYAFFLTLLGQKKPLWRWLVYFPLIPFLGFALCVLRDPYLFLGVGFILSAILADNFATHYFYLKTTVPMARRRSRKLRRLWRHRLRFSGPSANGVEFYKLACLTPLAVFVFLFAMSRGTPPGFIAPNVLYLITGLASLLCLPVIIEWGVSFFFHHNRVGFKAMFRAFRGAVVQWFTYNRHNAVGPCVFQSPVGNYVQRRCMTIAAIVVLAAGIAQLFSTHRELAYEYDRYLRPEIKDRSPRSLWDKAQDLLWLKNPGVRPSQKTATSSAKSSGLPGGNAQKSKEEALAPLEFIHPGTLPQKPTEQRRNETPSQFLSRFFRDEDQELKSKEQSGSEIGKTPRPEKAGLEPYQEAMLRRMSPEKREEFLENLRTQQSQQAERQQAPPAPKHFNDQMDESVFPYFLSAVALLAAGLVFLVVPAICSMLPPLLFLACCFSTSARVLGFYGQELGTDDPDRLLESETWDHLVQRIRASGDSIEKNSLLLGVNAFDDTPVIVPRSILCEHAHILGDSGSGKTSLGLASIITQLIRFGDCSLVILDMKGDDQALLEGARIESERAELSFRWFTNQLDHSSYIFNPLTQRHIQGLSLYQRTDMVTTALGLQYGTDYGQSYFSSANAERLYHIYHDEPDVPSFARMAELVQRPSFDLPPDLRASTGHLRACLSRLADCRPLNAHSGDCDKPTALSHAIDMSDLFVTPQVLYFSLPAAVSTTYGPEIARLAIYSLLGAARATAKRDVTVHAPGAFLGTN